MPGLQSFQIRNYLRGRKRGWLSPLEAGIEHCPIDQTSSAIVTMSITQSSQFQVRST